VDGAVPGGVSRRHTSTTALASCPNTAYCMSQSTLELFHLDLGLPWWGAIVATTIIARSLITFPFAVYQERQRARMHLLKSKTEELVEVLPWKLLPIEREKKTTPTEFRVVMNKKVRVLSSKLVRGMKGSRVGSIHLEPNAPICLGR
jgi:hypothetical protein